MRYFLEFVKFFSLFDRANEEGFKTESFGEHPEVFREHLTEGLAEAKVFTINDSIKKLLILTKVPKINDKIMLPYPYVFLDVKFKKKELKKLGIDIDYDEIIGMLVSRGNMVVGDKIVGTDLRISVMSRIGKDYMEKVGTSSDLWFDTFNENVNITDEKYKDYDIEINRNYVADKHGRKLVFNFFLAFLNFINNPEIKIIEVEYGKEKNIKRIKKGKVPIPNSFIIQLDGVMKKYISDLEQSGSFEYDFRFWVRGHFRTLRDEKRYGNNVGKRTWIMPFIKGKGVLVEKEYVVENIK